MKAWRIPVVVFAVAVFTVTVMANLAVVSAQSPAPGAVQAEKAAKNAAGKVVGVTPTSISVEVQESGQPKTLDFAIDSNTKVEGKLAKNASVQVTYRIEEGRNIATLVRVMA
jgi:hypothetical protein